MAGFTNRGKYLFMQYATGTASPPTSFYMALCTSATAPTADTNTLSQLTEIAAGNGYTSGGLIVERSATGFPTVTENDSTDLASATIKNLSFTASGGNLPASGSGARYAVLTTDEGTVGNRQIIAYYDLSSDRTVSSGQSLQLNAFLLQFTET